MGLKKGQTNNPAGRPKGSLNKPSLLQKAVDEQLLKVAEGNTKNNLSLVVNGLIGAAIEGDMVATKVLVDRYWPAPRLKPESPPIKFEFDPEASISEQVRALLKAVAGGEISPDAAHLLTSAIKDSFTIATEERLIEENEQIRAEIEEIRALAEQLQLKRD